MNKRAVISLFLIVGLFFFNIQSNLGVSLPVSISQGLNIDNMEVLDPQMRIQQEDNIFVAVETQNSVPVQIKNGTRVQFFSTFHNAADINATLIRFIVNIYNTSNDDAPFFSHNIDFPLDLPIAYVVIPGGTRSQRLEAVLGFPAVDVQHVLQVGFVYLVASRPNNSTFVGSAHNFSINVVEDLQQH